MTRPARLVSNNILEIIQNSRYWEMRNCCGRIAKKIGVHRSLIAHAIAGRRILPFHALEKFCRCLQVLPEEVYEDYENLYDHILGNPLRRACARRNKTMKEVAKICKVDYRHLKRIARNRGRSSKNLMRKIARTLWRRKDEIF